MDRKIQTYKWWVHHWEKQANRVRGEVKQLESTIKEEGLFCVECCVVMSVSMCITVEVLSVPHHGM